MASTVRVGLRVHTVLLCCALVTACAPAANADPKPLSKEEQAKVDKAIDKGVSFLKRIQRDKGDWPPSVKGQHQVAYTILPAYALLESGVPADDPVIQRAADHIRPRVLKLDRTYDVSLAILFLDRLGDPKDKDLIRSLGVRLLAAQHVTGGWNYRCTTLRKEQEDALSKALEELEKRLDAGEKSRTKLLSGLGVPHSMTTLPIFRSINDPSSLPWQDPPANKETQKNMLYVGSTDNSNTQFAMLGLWAAQRHGIAVRPSFRLMVERFERSQQEDGAWPYNLEKPSPDPTARPSMICVGLLALGIGRGLKLPTYGSAQQQGVDLRILKGLASLSRDIGVAAGGVDRSYSWRGTYYLWSIERVGMLYDLPTIGDKDWYRWGAGILVVGQRSDGDWRNLAITKQDGMGFGGTNGPIVETSFALLFLKRSHPMKELTPKLPYTAKELNEGITQLQGERPPLERPTSASSHNKKP